MNTALILSVYRSIESQGVNQIDWKYFVSSFKKSTLGSSLKGNIFIVEVHFTVVDIEAQKYSTVLKVGILASQL